MDYAQQQRDPRQHMLGTALVIGFHVILAYALLNGLARKVIDVVKKPLDVSLVEEIKAEPPPKPTPPPKQVVPQPKSEVPPPFVPKVEVAVETPQPAPTITASNTPPEPAPPAPVAEPAPPPPVNVAVACPNHVSVRSKVPYPTQAQRQGISGDVLIEFTVAPDGGVGGINVVRSSNAVFNAVSIDAVSQLRCVGQGKNVRVRVPFSFRLDS